jgi:hypothetical protein
MCVKTTLVTGPSSGRLRGRWQENHPLSFNHAAEVAGTRLTLKNSFDWTITCVQNGEQGLQDLGSVEEVIIMNAGTIALRSGLAAFLVLTVVGVGWTQERGPVDGAAAQGE